MHLTQTTALNAHKESWHCNAGNLKKGVVAENVVGCLQCHVSVFLMKRVVTLILLA
jgi:hypothetical protein